MNRRLYRVLKRPLTTEKSTCERELHNKVLFEVDVAANKIEIKQAVEELFAVTVLDVNVLAKKAKKKRHGRFYSQAADTKKAYVTLKPGASISFFEGV